MKTVESKNINVVLCPHCGYIMWLVAKDFLLLNNERICYGTCESCGEMLKIIKEGE